MDDRIIRITEMEECLDRITGWLSDRSGDISADVEKLDEYYRSDFEADERGELPEDLKRGVLSEDAVYDALTEYARVKDTMTYEEAVKTIPCGRYRHFKGNEYEVIGIARNSEDESPMVIYRALYGEGALWCRPASMWNEEITRDGRTMKRFTRTDDNTN